MEVAHSTSVDLLFGELGHVATPTCKEIEESLFWVAVC